MVRFLSLPVLAALFATGVCAMAQCDSAQAQQIVVATPAGVYVRPYPLNAYPYGYPYNPRRAYRQAVRANVAAAIGVPAVVVPAPYPYGQIRIPATRLPTDYSGATRGPRDFLSTEPSTQYRPSTQFSERQTLRPTPAPPSPGPVSEVPAIGGASNPSVPQSGVPEAIPSPPSEPGPVEF